MLLVPAPLSYEEDLLRGETDGLAVDFTVPRPYVKVKDSTTAANRFFGDPQEWFTQGGTSPKLVKNALGQLEWSPHNFLWWSENINGADVGAAGVSRSGQLVTAVAGSGTHDVWMDIGNILVANHIYTYTIDITAGTWPYILINIEKTPSGSTNWVSAVANLNTGEITQTGQGAGGGVTYLASSITSLASGRWRITLTVTNVNCTAFNCLLGFAQAATGNSFSSAWGEISWTAAGTETLTVDNWRLNKGYTPTRYLATTNNIKYGLGISYGEGLLVEPAATNLCLQSQDIGTTWTNSESSVSLNAVTAPDGSQTADKLIESINTNYHTLTQTITVTANTTYCHSVYFKAGERSHVYLEPESLGGGSGINVLVNLSTGVSQTSVWGSATLSGGGADYLGDGWYRAWVAGIHESGTTTLYLRVYLSNGVGSNYDGDGTSGLYVWGAQVEAGRVATSYIPTYGATVTRAVDSISKALTALPFSATVGTAFVRARRFYSVNDAPSSFPRYWQMDGDVDDNESIYAALNDGTGERISITDGGVTQYQQNIEAVGANQTVQITNAWATNDFAESGYGRDNVTDISGTLPTVTILRIGNRKDGARALQGFIEKFVYVPRRVSNADLPTWRYEPPETDDLLEGETQGMAVDFTQQHPRARVKDPATPANNFYGHPDDWFTNSGTSPKMVKTLDGKLVWSPHNITYYSEDLTNWTNSNTTDSGQTLTASSGSAVHSIWIAGGVVISNVPYTLSVDLKMGTHRYISLGFCDSTTEWFAAVVDLLTGSITQTGAGASGTFISGTVTPLSDGWYRVALTGKSSGLSNSTVGVGFAGAATGNIFGSYGDITTTTTGTETVLINRAQINRGYVPTKYLKTTSAARMGIPINAGEGLIVEPAATNSIIKSNLEGWWVGGSTLVINDVMAPDGTQTAATMTEDTYYGGHKVLYDSSIAHQTTDVIAASIFVKHKSGSTRRCRIMVIDSGTYSYWFNADFDLVTQQWTRTSTEGSGSTILTYWAESLGDGWFRLCISGTINNAANVKLQIDSYHSFLTTTNYTGDRQSGFHFWGAQVEIASAAKCPSSYIPTYGATVTRAADDIWATLTGFPYSTTAGTLYTDSIAPFDAETDDENVVAGFFDTSASAYTRSTFVSYSGAPSLYAQLYSSAAQQMAANNYVQPRGIRGQSSMAWIANDGAISFNGRPVATDNTIGLSSSLNRLCLGGKEEEGKHLCSLLRRIAYVPRRVSDADLPMWRYDGQDYVAQGASFDGTNDYMTRGAALTGAADSKQWTVSVWAKLDVLVGTPTIFTGATTVGGATTRCRLRRNSGDRVGLYAHNVSATLILDIETADDALLAGTGWHHFLFSVDLNTNNRHVYVDDVVSGPVINTWTNDTINFTISDFSCGAVPDGSSKWTGDIADLWWAPGVYIDFDIEANRRKFISAEGKPVDLGSTGQNPTGTSPIVFMSGLKGTWHTNKGTGGGFTEYGGLEAAITSPSQISRPTPPYRAKGEYFSGTNDYLTRGAGLTGAADSKKFTLSCWVKNDVNNILGRILSTATAVGGGTTQFRLNRHELNFYQLIAENAAGTTIGSASFGSGGYGDVAAGWVHLLLSWDLTGANRSLGQTYVNDISWGPPDGAWTDDTIDFTLGDWSIGADPDGTDLFTGDIADLWFQPDLYIDLSIEANRRKFIGYDGKPVFLGSSGQLPTGTAPLVYIRDSPLKNVGIGGEFTESSSMSASTTSPSDETRNVYSYYAKPAYFDGDVDYLTRGAGLTGAADSKLVTGSLWIYAREDGSTWRIINGATTVAGGTSRNVIQRASSNVVRMEFHNTAGTIILDVESSSDVVADSGWVHVLFSFDLSDTAKRHLYLNDISDLSVITYTNDTIDFTQADWGIGARPDNYGKIPSDIADLWFAPGVYIDFSIEANRRKFISASKKPVELGGDGSLPTGTAPLVFLSGDVGAWNLNKGSGGGFTVTGALTASTTRP